MSAPIVIAVLAVLFLSLGVARAVRNGSLSHPRTRTWLLVGAIFGVMSAYSYFSG
jgi:hypothetical protein